MVVVDRTHALVPIAPSNTRKGALHVTEPGILTALVELFEQAWNTAVPLGAARPDDPQNGLTDRTIRRQVASIMERLGASSRFEAGIKAAQRGWLRGLFTLLRALRPDPAAQAGGAACLAR